MIKKLLLILAIGSTGLLLFTSCTPTAAPQAEQASLPVIEVIPSVIAPGGSVEFMGANFLPNEKVFVDYLYPPVAEGGGPIECGFVITADEIGSFSSSLRTRQVWDMAVCPVIVSDQNGKAITSTLFVLQKPPEEK